MGITSGVRRGRSVPKREKWPGGMLPAAFVLFMCFVSIVASARLPVASSRGSLRGELFFSPPVPGEEITAKRGPLAELGRRLFFDPAASSRMGMRSCADCHDPAHGYSDPQRVSLDDTGPTARHSQTLVDAEGDKTAHWDGAFASIDSLVRARLNVRFVETYYGRDGSDAPPSVKILEDATDGAAPERAEVESLPPAEAAADAGGRQRSGDLAPAFVDRELAARSGESAANRLNDHGRYAAAFTAAFGSPQATVSRIALAIAEYCRTIRSGTSGFDRFAAGDVSALEPAAVRGLDLFRGRAGCVRCHSMEGSRPVFTDRGFHNTGVEWQVRHQESDSADQGRRAVTGNVADSRRFKTPSLRDVNRRGPFMHDGSLATLEDVIRYYASGGSGDPYADERLPRFKATGTDVDDLAEFLRSLTSDRRPGLARAAWAERAARTRLLFVDGWDEPLPGIEVVLQPAGDVLPGASAREFEARSLRTDSTGAIEFAPGRTTHTRIILPEGLPLLGGDLVVDTCAATRLVVGIAGRAIVSVPVTEGVEPPATLKAWHSGSVVFPHQRVPTTVFRRVGVADDGLRAKRAWYDAPRRLDVGAEVAFQWPTGTGEPTTLYATLQEGGMAAPAGRTLGR